MTGSASFDVRQLATGDVGLMRALNRLFAEVFEDLPSYDASPPDDDYLERVLARETTIVLAAMSDGRPIGALVAYELEKLEQARSEIYIYDLAVAESWRRQGVATALIGKVRELASGRGAWVVFVQADYADPPAIALYEKLGRREEVLHFDIDPA
jgi:aminoglycoside 3-N-acetyltransferase I